MTENELSRIILSAAIEVHRVLGGPGLLESVYEEALAEELTLRGIHIERQKQIPIPYKGKQLTTPLRLDLLAGGLVVVEVKATEQNIPLYNAQVLTYLRLTDLKLGMVVNFGYRLVKDGTQRVVNGL